MAHQNDYDDFESGRIELEGEAAKIEPPSPSEREGYYPFSRCSSTGSVHTPGSSAPATDDEDSDSKSQAYKDRRREAHTQAEQKRRDAIKKGYDCLQELVPRCQQADLVSGYKLSKATILQRSIDYIQFLLQQKKKQEEDLSTLRKEVVALQIMKANYEQIVKAHQSQPDHHCCQVSDEVKFQVFRTFLDSLFMSFDSATSVANFAELSGCMLCWVEEYGKPQTLRELMLSILRQLNPNIS